MKICGLNKTTLLDYPGKVACTIFIGGCNFRCPFCHNGSLVLHASEQPEITPEEIFTFLKRRKGILEGVCVTGGEPTLYSELPEFLQKIHSLGYAVKLDTNGTNPQMLKKLVKEGYIDKVAMDIKAAPENYPVLTGISSPDMDAVKRSISFLLEGHVDYEFRTTIVKGLHTEQDFIRIGQWIAGAKACYLQVYKDSSEVIVPGFSSFSPEESEHFRQILLKTVSLVEIRGID